MEFGFYKRTPLFFTPNQHWKIIYILQQLFLGDFMNLFLWLVVLMISLIMLKSLIDFIRGDKLRLGFQMEERKFSLEVFYTLLMIYTIVMIGFGLIYFILLQQGNILIETKRHENRSIFHDLFESIYFSGVTLLTIGYGDISPVGMGRFVALIEALIGYILPAAFVLRIVSRKDLH